MKADRLLAIVMLLINRQRVSAQELADYFEVSTRTVYRDIEAICQAGVPIASFQGNNGGFSIVEGYKLDRNVLTPDEMFSIITSLIGVGRILNDRKVNTLAEKMKALLPRKDLDSLRLSQTVVFDFKSWNMPEDINPKIELLRAAIEAGRVVAFYYTDSTGNPTYRLVEPMVVVLKEFAWYLYGYCRTREDYRTFKLSRMRDLLVTGEAFTRRRPPPDEFPWDGPLGSDAPKVKFVLRFAPQVRASVEDYFLASWVQQLEDGSLQVVGELPDDDRLCRMILSYGPDVEVLAPARLRSAIAEQGRRTWQVYRPF